MKIDVASCTVKSLRGAKSLTVDGNEYEANTKGEMEIAQAHLTVAREHGFELVDGAEHDGTVKIVATGHDPDKTEGQNAAAQANDGEEEEVEEVDYDKMTKPQLLELAAKREIEVESDANKKAIIAALVINDHLTAGEYDKVLKEDLVAYAEKRGVPIDSKATKEEIVAALVDADKE